MKIDCSEAKANGVRKIKVRFNYEVIMEKARAKNIQTMKQLCKESGVNYHSFMQYKNKPSKGISFNNAWLLADYLDCDLMQIVYPVWNE